MPDSEWSSFDLFPSPEDASPEPAITFPEQVSFFEPLEVFVPVRMLREITHNNLKAMRNYLAGLEAPLSPDEQRELDAAVHQREAFLAWLDTCPHEMTFMALYPTQVTELQED